MSVDEVPLTDVSDMPLVHDAFRRGFGEARSQLAFIDADDAERAAFFADYLAELLWLLHSHHSGEDEVIYPLLVERVPDEVALFSRMDGQHTSVEALLDAANDAAAAYRASASAADAAALADACEVLLAQLETHLREEEDELLPVAARYLTQEEWNRLPGHALSSYTGERIWLPFGLATEAFPAAKLDVILDGPSPIGGMWRGGGGAAFAEHMRLIRDEAAWASRT